MAFQMNYNTLVASVITYTENNSDSLANNMPILILFGQRRIAREMKTLGLQEYVLGNFQASQGVIAKPARWLQTISMNYGTGEGQINGAEITDPGTGFWQFPATVTVSAGSAAFQTFVTNGVLTQIVCTDPGDLGEYAMAPDLTLTPADVDAANGATGATAICTIAADNNGRVILLPRSYEYARMYWPDSTIVGAPKFYSDYDFNHWLITPTPNGALPVEIAYYQILQPIDEDQTANWLTENAPDLLLYAVMVEAQKFLKNFDTVPQWEAFYQTAAEGFRDEDRGRVAGRETVRIPTTSAPGAGAGAPR